MHDHIVSRNAQWTNPRPGVLAVVVIGLGIAGGLVQLALPLAWLVSLVSAFVGATGVALLIHPWLPPIAGLALLSLANAAAILWVVKPDRFAPRDQR